MKINIFLIVIVLLMVSCAYDPHKSLNESDFQVITTNVEGQGFQLQLQFEKGKAYNYPLMAVWMEDMDGNYMQTLYVSQSIAKAFFKYGDKSKSKWAPGPIRRPAALPYWAHKRGVKENDGLYVPTQATAMPDAITGASPQGNFTLKTKTEDKKLSKFKVLFEINQAWDWNTYWNNSKYPDDNEYKTSCQPALVYEAVIDVNSGVSDYEMKLIGHSHYAGKTGELFTDLSTITTAKDITKNLKIKVKN